MGLDRGRMDIERGLVRTRAGYIHYRASETATPRPAAYQSAILGALSGTHGRAGRDARPIAIDYPSHGASDHISFQPQIADYAVRRGGDRAVGAARSASSGEAVGAAVAIDARGCLS